MAKFDLPSIIQHVLADANVSQVPLVCHSQGCTQTVAALVDDVPGVRAALPKVSAQF
jgi:hypothetical protein